MKSVHSCLLLDWAAFDCDIPVLRRSSTDERHPVEISIFPGSLEACGKICAAFSCNYNQRRFRLQRKKGLVFHILT